MNRNFLMVLVLGIAIIACTENTTHNIPPQKEPINTTLEIPDKTVNKSELYYNNKQSRWTLDDQLYTGYAVSFYQDSILKEKFGVLNGKKQNEAIHWYADGHYKHLAHYHEGKLYGEKKSWSPDSLHVLVSHLNYVAGKAHGEQKKWYPSGELFKKLNLNMGKEEGLQQAFRKNGVLFANYEARGGRIFGLKKTALCFGLEDENIQYEQ